MSSRSSSATVAHDRGVIMLTSLSNKLGHSRLLLKDVGEKSESVAHDIELRHSCFCLALCG